MTRQPLTEAERQRLAQEAPAKELMAKPLREDSFTRYCHSYGLEYSFSVNLIFIRTKVSTWRIYHSNCYVERVEHENTGFTQRKKTFNKGGRIQFRSNFHKQPVFQHDIYAVARYIAKHDKLMLRNFTNTNPLAKQPQGGIPDGK